MRQTKKNKSKIGLAPGSLVFTGEQKMEQTMVSLIQYNQTEFKESKIPVLARAIDKISSFDGISWINIDGLHDISAIETICSHFDIHKLSAEDILSIGQRPKLDEYPDYLHIIVKMFQLGDTPTSIEAEQLSLILKNDVLITFQERTGDVFDGVRKRLREGTGYLRKREADYLLYALLDAVVDHYFMIVEVFGEKMEDLETLLLENPGQATLNPLHAMRRETLNLRRSIYPLREVVSRFEKTEEPMVKESTHLFIRDLYDHTIQVIDTIEVFRDMASGMLDLYMNSVSNRMNEIMKVLTIMASIFIPLTFIAGVYGMNFENMPELNYPYAYFIVWGVMVVCVLGMLFYFKKKKWL